MPSTHESRVEDNASQTNSLTESLMLNLPSLPSEFFVSGKQPAQPELLVAAVLHLMSHYTVNSTQNSDGGSCVKLASVIERHLKILAELPDLAPVLRATCQQLSEQWSAVVECALPQQSKLNVLARWISSAR